MIKLDYSLQTPEERKQLVERYLEENPEPSAQYLEILADYLILCMEKQERKSKEILTENRLSTVNKRETSFENLASQFDNGEDGVYNLMKEDKNTIFYPKISITQHDIDTIPELQQVRNAIHEWERLLPTATGRSAFIIKKAIIDLRKDQYIIKEAFTKPARCVPSPPVKVGIKLEDTTTGPRQISGVSLLDPKVCSAILCNYSALKQNCYDNFYSDTWFLMEAFDETAARALLPYPHYERIVEYKIDGLSNADIRQKLQEEFGLVHSEEHISTLWRNKIPAIIASTAEDDYLNWYYLEVAPGTYKRCSKCGEVKLAHNKYFAFNKSSKDGFYSVCKACRNKKPLPLGQK